ncbi:hypothetical protein PP512_gp34 [Gordonia phage Denise]|uniref:Uncharacterized protein n=1 Tax=Gordonia phage Denise TaxID=2652879 RepID=A0A5P8DES7_9CAUD|nr:hypothetical protein PP512_gp34 [Gordonia phage Denise]QFP96650.1 hypothetical protein SEA_DENISE_34 [Gordonia phage Denise]
MPEFKVGDRVRTLGGTFVGHIVEYTPSTSAKDSGRLWPTIRVTHAKERGSWFIGRDITWSPEGLEHID